MYSDYSNKNSIKFILNKSPPKTDRETTFKRSYIVPASVRDIEHFSLHQGALQSLCLIKERVLL